MNVMGINEMPETGDKKLPGNNSNLMSDFVKGQKIEGKILKVTDKISIDFNGKEMTIPKSAIPNAKEGEIREFEVIDVSEQSITLKEITDNTESQESTKIVSTTVEKDRGTLEDIGKSKEEVKALEQEKIENFEEAKKILNDIVNRMTEKDYKALTEAEISPESSILVQLERALNKIKEQLMLSQENVERQVEKNKDFKEQIEKVGIANICDSPYKRIIAEKLLNANLPITKENIEKIAETLELSKTVEDISNKEIGYMIEKELAPTIENFYQASYSGYQDNGKISENIWKEILPQAEAVIKEANMEVNDKTRSCARWLIENNLPLTVESLEKYYMIQDIKKNYQDESVLNKIIDTLTKGEAPQKTSLEETNLSIEDILGKLETITDKAIEKTIKENKKINLVNLIETQEQLDKTDKTTDNIFVQEIQKNIEAVTAKRQLEEIRLKMTTEAGYKLSMKGIRLDTTELTKVVEELKEIENNYYKNLLKEGKLPDNNENIEILKETSEKINELKEAPSYVLGTTFSARTVQTITTLCESAQSVKTQLEKANAAYEALSTEVRKDLGDSIQKAFQNVNSILDSIGVEQTQENQRAVKILGYNQMEITKDSINQIKNYDNQVNTLMKELHPAVTVELIKRNINPLHTPIEELNGQIKAIKEELKVTEEEKYSKYLWKLDKNQELTQEEKKAYIGIYRLLNNVEKTNGAAVGALVNAGEEITLNNLLRAVRTKKSGGIDKTIDDTFGTLENLTFKKETITDQIYSAFNQDAAYEVEHVLNTISPEKLKEFSEKIEGTTKEKLDQILNMPLKNLEAEFSKEKETDLEIEYNRERLDEIKKVIQNSEKELSFLTEADIEPSISYIQAANYLLLEEQPFFKEVNHYLKKTSLTEEKEEAEDILDGLDEDISDNTQLQEDYKKLGKNIRQILEKEYENPTITSNEISQLKLLSNTTFLMQSLSQREHYEIPVQVGESITNIRLTVIRGTKETGKVHINVNSELLGNIEADFSVKKEEVKGIFLCDNKLGLEILKEQKDTISEDLQEADLDLKQIHYSIDKKLKDFYTGNQTKTKETNTKTLYQVAKILVKNIKSAELKQI